MFFDDIRSHSLFQIQIFNWVFLKVNKATMNMLHRVEALCDLWVCISLLFFSKSYKKFLWPFEEEEESLLKEEMLETAKITSMSSLEK